MTWLPSVPNIAVTTNARDAKNVIAPSQVVFVGADSPTTILEVTNGSMTPTIHSSALSGDLMVLVCVYAANDNMTNYPATPSGWTRYIDYANSLNPSYQRVSIFYKIHSGSESSPTATLTYTTASPLFRWFSQVLVFRGANTGTPFLENGTSYESNSNATTMAGRIHVLEKA